MNERYLCKGLILLKDENDEKERESYDLKNALGKDEEWLNEL